MCQQLEFDHEKYEYKKVDGAGGFWEGFKAGELKGKGYEQLPTMSTTDCDIWFRKLRLITVKVTQGENDAT